MLPRTRYERTLLDDQWAYVRQTGQKQKPPYNLMCEVWNLRWLVEYADVKPANQFPNVKSWVSDFYAQAGDSRLETKATNLAYTRMVSQLGDASSLGATLTAERRETWGMVVTIIERALRAARNIRKLNFAAAARDLGLPYHERTVVRRHPIRLPNGKTRVYRIRRKQFRWHDGRWYAKELGSGWLMFSYGVRPLCQDIYNGIDLLQREFPYYRARGGAKLDTRKFKVLQRNWTKIFSAEISVSQSVSVRVRNPNLWIANRLGLVNPAQWALEGIPFSFVVDWFSNLSSVVGSFTDFVGLEVNNPCINRRMTWVEENAYTGDSANYARWRKRRDDYQRSLGIKMPVLTFAYERFQWQRGLNAISLLLQFMKGK